MIHLPGIVHDLALILIAAAIVTVLFRKLRQPVVLGYIIAGFIVGPHFGWAPSVSDTPNIQVWAEIGVIFLLFALGLEFSFKKLAKVGGAASVTAILEIIAMIGIGFFTGRLFGWTPMNSLFLGGVLAISSTTIIIRAFEEVGVKKRGFVSLVFGVLIVEDLVAILLLVLLSTVAVSQRFAGEEMLYSGAKLVFFLTAWFLFGIFLLPTFLRSVKRFVNEETLLVMALGLCFAMVVFATAVGFSPALGAFVMGSLLAETTEAERIEHLIRPVKDLFAAVFFVSVGMMIDPKVIYEYAFPIAVITLITIFGKIASTMFGALIAGRSLRHSVQSGFSLAQIGEFSFIIAGLGQSLHVTSDFLYPVVVSVSAITTFSTPYLIRSADPAYHAIDRVLPESWRRMLARYSANAQSVSATSEWSQLVRSYVIRILVNGTVILAIFLTAAKYLPNLLNSQLGNIGLSRVLSLIAALVISAPFVWALALGRSKNSPAERLWLNHRYRLPIFALEIARVIVAIALITTLASRLIRLRSAFAGSVVITLLLLLAFSRYLKSLYGWIEGRFIQNLGEREAAMKSDSPALAPWDAHIAWFEVHPNSSMVGRNLAELGIRENYGVTIALIQRGVQKITAPMRHECIYPADRLAIIGTDEQLSRFQKAVEPALRDSNGSDEETAALYSLQRVEIPIGSSFLGKTIRDSGLRERAKGLVVGIERRGQRILNPDSTLTIEVGDHLWIVGDPRCIRELRAQNDMTL